MRTILVIIFSGFTIFGQNIKNVIDSSLILDTNIQTLPLITDTKVQSPPKALDTNTPSLLSGRQRKIMAYGEISFGYVWLQYDKPFDFWAYSYRFGYGLSNGIVVNL